MARPLGPVPEHGTRQRYQLRGRRCDCLSCRSANRAYIAERRAARRTGVRSSRGCPHTELVEGSHGQFCTACLTQITAPVQQQLPPELMIRCTHSLQEGRSTCSWCGEVLRQAS